MEPFTKLSPVSLACTPSYSSLDAASSSSWSPTSASDTTGRLGTEIHKSKCPNSTELRISFILCGAPSDAKSAAARREVRSQAAKRSAEQRKATIAERYGGKSLPRRSHHTSSGESHNPRRAARKPSRAKEATEALPPDSPVKLPPLPRPVTGCVETLSSRKHEEPDGMLEADVPALVSRYIKDAVSLLDPTIAKYAYHILSAHALVSSFFSGTLAYMDLALSAGEKEGPVGNQILSRPLVLWMRQHMLVAINEAIANGTCPDDHLAAAVAVAAGWEGEFGDPEMCDVHLQAFRDIVTNSKLNHSHARYTGAPSGHSTPILSTAGSWSPVPSSTESPGPVTPPQHLHCASTEDDDMWFQQRITEDALAAVYQPLFDDP
ncbi:hypothetical protein LTR85_001608 [Meristemomyces frigidus]|nr:hypothetical protein LTR85_001608 [Meristemomyces frigidus]